MASEQHSWALVGDGNIGGELRYRLAMPDAAARLGLQTLPSFVVRSAGIFDSEGAPTGQMQLADVAQLPDVMFVAMPSTNDGVAAYRYITHALNRGTQVVTAEKGAAANFFPQLKERSEDFKRLGISATVGGGTRLLQEVKMYCDDIGNVSQLHLTLNGTLAAIFGAMAPEGGHALSLEEAVQQAVENGYAEPGSTNPLDVIRAEAEGDVPKKTAILFNHLGLSPKTLTIRNFAFSLADHEITQAASDASRQRFAVSIFPEENTPPQDVIGGFAVTHDGWRIVGGFQDITANPLLGDLARPSGATNGFVIGLGPDNAHGVYSLSGPGAGVGPTVSAMLYDYLSFGR